MSVHPRIPGAGPLLLTVPGLSDVQILAHTASPEIKFTWPRPYVFSGFWLGEEKNPQLPQVVAKLRLRMLDDSRNELVIDGTGNTESGPATSFMGRSPRWHAFRRVVRTGHKWTFQIENDSALDAIPQFYLRVEEE